MCLVSCLPSGTPKITEETISFIRKGASSNTHGSGFMYKRINESRIYVKKGYFDVEKLIADLKDLNLKEEDELVIHHRISTAGLISKENTHPFICNSNHDICATTDGYTDTDYVLVHNGMFSNLNSIMKLNPDFSDTYAFSKYIMGNKNFQNILKEDDTLASILIKDIVGFSRISILRPIVGKSLITVGNFNIDNNYLHSNGGYKSYIIDRGGSSFNNNENFQNREDSTEFRRGFNKSVNNDNTFSDNTGFDEKDRPVTFQNLVSSNVIKHIRNIEDPYSKNKILTLNPMPTYMFDFNSFLKKYYNDFYYVDKISFDYLHKHYVCVGNITNISNNIFENDGSINYYSKSITLQTKAVYNNNTASVKVISLQDLNKMFFIPKSDFYESYISFAKLYNEYPGVKFSDLNDPTYKNLQKILNHKLKNKKERTSLELKSLHSKFKTPNSKSKLTYNLLTLKLYYDYVNGWLNFKHRTETVNVG